jgi:hypothetical protein
MKLSRKELYEIVWSKPMTTLAKEYGISDVGLAKICRRHQVPLPPRGYWAKLAAGIHVQKTHLQATKESETVFIETRKVSTDQAIKDKQLDRNGNKTAIQLIGRINVPNKLSDPHKFTVNTQLYFEKAIKQINKAKVAKNLPENYQHFRNLMYRGRINCYENNCYKITVSETLVGRALIFVDTLAKELELNGFVIRANKDDQSDSCVYVIKDNLRINFQISEGFKYQPFDKSSKKLSELEKILFSNKEPVATGRLTFSAQTAGSKIGKSWTDGKRKIEESLAEIINDFLKLAPRHKVHIVEQEIKRNQQSIEQEVYRAKESKRYQENAIYNQAVTEAIAFHDFIRLETYLNHLERVMGNSRGQLTAEATSWLETVRTLALITNPTNKRLQKLGY